jgi:hypothetical protein
MSSGTLTATAGSYAVTGLAVNITLGGTMRAFQALTMPYSRQLRDNNGMLRPEWHDFFRNLTDAINTYNQNKANS